MSSVIYETFKVTFATLYPAYASYKAVKTKNVKDYVRTLQLVYIIFCIRGVARNLLRGDKPGDLGDGTPSPPAGSGGRAPVRVLGQSPQKPETNLDKKNKQTTSIKD